MTLRVRMSQPTPSHSQQSWFEDQEESLLEGSTTPCLNNTSDFLSLSSQQKMVMVNETAQRRNSSSETSGVWVIFMIVVRIMNEHSNLQKASFCYGGDSQSPCLTRKVHV